MHSKSICSTFIYYLYIVLVSKSFLFVKSDIVVYKNDFGHLVEEFRSMPASFGAPFPPDGLTVAATRVMPSNACGPIQEPPLVASTYDNSSTLKWAALIKRGGCPYETKVRNAQAAGYSAAIVYDRQTNGLELMTAVNGTGISIPSMLVGKSTGRSIIRYYSHDDGFILKLDSKFTSYGLHRNACFTRDFPYICDEDKGNGSKQ